MSKKYIQNHHQNLFSLQLSLKFQERIAMNLKIGNRHIILIDLWTRLSAVQLFHTKTQKLSWNTYFTMDICIWTTSKDSRKQWRWICQHSIYRNVWLPWNHATNCSSRIHMSTTRIVGRGNQTLVTDQQNDSGTKIITKLIYVGQLMQKIVSKLLQGFLPFN